MSCWQRLDWTGFLECAYAYLAEPVPLWLPWGIWLLIFGGICFGAGWLLERAVRKIFGRDPMLDRVFDLLSDLFVEIRWYLHEWRKQFQEWRLRRQAAGEEPDAAKAPPGEERERPAAPERPLKTDQGERP